MERFVCVLLAVGCLILAAPALGQSTLAQIAPLHPPELENRIPAPLPPPPQPPIINGPLGQGPSPGVYQPPGLTTHSDRTIHCQDQALGAGLRGGKLDAYVRRCANAH
jgi:hypothetical protein